MQQPIREFVRLGQETLAPFAEFLRSLKESGDAEFFHPHGFDLQSAEAITRMSERGRDEYWLLTDGAEVCAYGMLRGWEEGYSVPSLGLAVAPRHRGQGLSRIMMKHLHTRARERGAECIRLKVDRRNLVARRLYEANGYVLEEYSPGELVGKVKLDALPGACRGQK